MFSSEPNLVFRNNSWLERLCDIMVANIIQYQCIVFQNNNSKQEHISYFSS